MSAGVTVTLSSPAKINPRLEVLARRPDGQHELSTTLLALDLRDELELSLLDSGRLEVSVSGPASSSDIPADETNLAVRAARLAIGCAGVRRAPGLAQYCHRFSYHYRITRVRLCVP